MVVVLMLLVLLENMLPRSRFKFRIRHGMLPRRTMIIVIVCGREQIGESWYRNLGSVFDRIVVFRCVVVFSTHSAGFGNALTLKTTKSNVEMSVFFCLGQCGNTFQTINSSQFKTETLILFGNGVSQFPAALIWTHFSVFSWCGLSRNAPGISATWLGF